MQVILLEKMNVGDLGTIVNVKDGYGRYLLRQEKVVRATNENKAFYEKHLSELKKKNDEIIKEATSVAGSISSLKVCLKQQAGKDGRLYGAVTPRCIADAMQELGVELHYSKIKMVEKIKEAGIYDIPVELHHDVKTVVKLYVNVDPANEEAEMLKKAAKELEEEDVPTSLAEAEEEAYTEFQEKQDSMKSEKSEKVDQERTDASGDDSEKDEEASALSSDSTEDKKEA